MEDKNNSPKRESFNRDMFILAVKFCGFNCESFGGGEEKGRKRQQIPSIEKSELHLRRRRCYKILIFTFDVVSSSDE